MIRIINRYQNWKVRPITNPILEGGTLTINKKIIKGTIPVNRIPVSLYEMNSMDSPDRDGNKGFTKRFRRFFCLAV